MGWDTPTKPSTNYSTPSKNDSDWSPNTINSTNYSSVSVNASGYDGVAVERNNWALEDLDGSPGYVLLPSGVNLLLQTGGYVNLQ